MEEYKFLLIWALYSTYEAELESVRTKKGVYIIHSIAMK